MCYHTYTYYHKNLYFYYGANNWTHFWSGWQPVMETELLIISYKCNILTPHTTQLVCVKFIYDWRALQFNLDSERKIFEVYLFVEFLSEICREEITEEIFFSHFSFWCLTWDTNLGFTFNKPANYLPTILYYYITYLLLLLIWLPLPNIAISIFTTVICDNL